MVLGSCIEFFMMMVFIFCVKYIFSVCFRIFENNVILLSLWLGNCGDMLDLEYDVDVVF